jgi:superkiller protein 3
MRNHARIVVLLFAACIVVSAMGCSKKKEVRNNADLAEVEVRKGIQLAGDGMMEEALAHFKKAMKYNPSHPRAWCGIGSIYREKQKYEEAIKYYEKAIELDPKYAICYDNLGIAYMRMNKPQEALDAFGKAVSADPGYVDVHFNLGELYELTGNTGLAIEEFDKFIARSQKQDKVEEVKKHLEKLKSAASSGAATEKAGK